MEVVEKVEKTWAEVVELKHPLADYLVLHLPVYNMAVLVEYVHGVPYGAISFGKVTLSAETLSVIAEAKRKRKKTEDVCIAKRDNIVYVYLPERKHLVKFVDGKLEYDISDTENYRDDIYPLEDVVIVEKLKEICK